MTMDFVIWGSSGHAKVLADIIQGLPSAHVLVLFDNDPKATPAIVGVPILSGLPGFNAWISGIPNVRRAEIGAIAAIGGGRGLDRLELLALFRSSGLQTPSLIHPSAIVSPSASIGSNCHILMGGCVSAEAEIGNATIINTAATVDHECQLAEGVHVGPGTTLCGCVRIGRGSFIGAGSVVLPRVTIGDNVTVGAGSVVTRDLPDNCIAYGHPARAQRTSTHPKGEP